MSSPIRSTDSPSPLQKPEQARTDAKQKDFKRPHQRLTNPYQHVANYSHEATTVPPYVLYGIANNENATDATSRDSKLLPSTQDPFISSMNNNWSTFFETVDSTPAYADGVMFRDVEAFAGLPDLNGKWGGDERLKHYLNHDGRTVGAYDEKLYVISSSDGTSESAQDQKDVIKRKSKAGYWMSTENRENWLPYLERILLYNNYVPLFFRVFMIMLSLVALGLSSRLFQISKRQYQTNEADITQELSQQPSTVMAICVQSVAIVYLLYIAYDEFKSKPLGIRNPKEKMRLILLDLLFIIFSGANLALSFNTLYDPRWVCVIDSLSRYSKVETICELQRALCSFLFLILVMWVFTFSISILRVIEKVSSNSGRSR